MDEEKANLGSIIQNWDEVQAIAQAKEGNPDKIAELLRKGIALQTDEARDWVAKKLSNKLPEKPGRKRTSAQEGKELAIYGMVLEIQKNQGLSEYKAIEVYLDKFDEKREEETGDPTSKDTIRTYIKNAKSFLIQMRSNIENAGEN
ncbi:MAG: hypothetical protein AAED33_07180 [Paracoccaceae bacterium]|jgi:hypothetical protein